MVALPHRFRLAGRPRTMSVRLRLTLIFSVLLAITLLGFTLMLSTAMNTVVYGMVERSVHDLTDQLIENKELQMDRVTIPASKFAAPEVFVQSRSLDGTVTSRTENLGERELPLEDNALSEVRSGAEWTGIVSIENSRLMVHSTLVTVQGRPVGILQVARSLAGPEDTARAIHGISLVGAGIAVIVAFGLGWALAGTALAPVDAMTTVARQIGSRRDFQHRLVHDGPEDEIGRLAGALNEMLASLSAAYSQADQALQAQQRLVADASHELRTPLTTIRGNLGLLQRTPPIADDDRKAVLNDIASETDRLIRLVNDLLALARTDAGSTLDLSPVSLRPFILELGRRAEATWPSHAVAVDSGDYLVLANRDALVQVVLILLDNAAKFTPHGGRISIWTSHRDDRVDIHIKDSGIGIAHDQLPHIFERFYRGDTVRSGTGAGLGLAIAESLMTGQNGTIAVESTPEMGTTFTLSLPCLP